MVWSGFGSINDDDDEDDDDEDEHDDDESMMKSHEPLDPPHTLGGARGRVMIMTGMTTKMTILMVFDGGDPYFFGSSHQVAAAIKCQTSSNGCS